MEKGKLPLVEANTVSLADIEPRQSIRVYRKWVAKNVRTQVASNFCAILLDKEGNAIQANMDLRDTDYFNDLLQLNNAYRISQFKCTTTKIWDHTLPNNTTLIFGRYTSIIPISNTDFPEHYFNFIAYNEVNQRADMNGAPLIGYNIDGEDKGTTKSGIHLKRVAQTRNLVVLNSLNRQLLSQSTHRDNVNIHLDASGEHCDAPIMLLVLMLFLTGLQELNNEILGRTIDEDLLLAGIVSAFAICWGTQARLGDCASLFESTGKSYSSCSRSNVGSDLGNKRLMGSSHRMGGGDFVVV
ncbi:hypothetical protein Tco_0500372 [Tanacetum coccineum]